MLTWKIDPTDHWPEQRKHRMAELLGYIPQIIPGNEPAVPEINANYGHGGGWWHMEGWTIDKAGVIQYQDTGEDDRDPPLTPVAVATNSFGETIRIYENAWVSIQQANGDFEVARMD